MAEPPKEEKKPAESPETKGWLYKWTNYIKVLFLRNQAYYRGKIKSNN